jgi:hypothetical protein
VTPCAPPDFAGVSREALREVEPTASRSIVERLGYAIAPGDLAIAHDSLRFLNAKAIASPAGIVELHEGDVRLLVVNVNRRALETTLGADLIYVNESTSSFVLVQYSRRATCSTNACAGGSRRRSRPACACSSRSGPTFHPMQRVACSMTGRPSWSSRSATARSRS